jgi:flagellar FliL protein
MRLSLLIVAVVSLACATIASAADEGSEQKKPVAYFSLKPSIISNVQGQAHYARCDIQLMTRDEQNLKEIELHAPALRHELLLMLGDQKGEALLTPAGREGFRKQALAAINKVLEKQTGKKGLVDDLFFTSFFVQ